MSTTPTMKFGKLTILNLDSSWATVSHDLDDSEVVAEREAALAEIDKQLAAAAPGAARISHLTHARHAVANMKSSAETMAALRTNILRNLGNDAVCRYDVGVGKIRLEGGRIVTEHDTVPADAEIVAAYRDAFAAVRADVDKSLRESMAKNPDDLLSDFRNLCDFTRNAASPALLADFEAAAARARTQVKARDEAAKPAKEAAEEMIAKARREWIEQNDPKALAMESDGYSINGRIAALIRAQAKAQVEALGYSVLPPAEEGDLKERRSPTDAAYDAADKILELDLVRYSTVRWSVLSGDDIEDEVQREVVEVDVYAPWDGNRLIVTLHVVGDGFACNESED